MADDGRGDTPSALPGFVGVSWHRTEANGVTGRRPVTEAVTSARGASEVDEDGGIIAALPDLR